MLGYCTQALHINYVPFIKVQVFWKGNKNWKNKSYLFWIYKWDIFSFLLAFSQYLNFRNHSDREYRRAYCFGIKTFITTYYSHRMHQLEISRIINQHIYLSFHLSRYVLLYLLCFFLEKTNNLSVAIFSS